MKYLIFIGLFAAGGIAGYLVGTNQSYNEVEIPTNETERITEFIYDTIVEQERIEVPVYTNPIDTVSEVIDTLDNTLILDTLKNNIFPRDTANEEGLNIKRDEQIATIRIPIIYLETSLAKDSTIKELLGINESRPTEMVAQFWSSPLNFTGYKLSKNTLILYGISEQYNYKVYHKNGTYYLSNEADFYMLRETQQFLPYSQVAESTVLDD